MRNPNFHVWSSAAQPAGYPDRIVLDTGYTHAQAVARVADGGADLVWGGSQGADVDSLGTRYAAQSHTTPGLFTHYLYLNTGIRPFNNIDARRAVAYAIDRRALTTAELDPSAPVTCQLLPPDFAAYQPHCPFTLPGGGTERWSAPDLPRAKDLVQRSGTHGAKVVVVSWDDPFFHPIVRITEAVLRTLHYRVSVRWLHKVVPPDYVWKHRRSWELGIIDWAADYPTPSDYLAAIGSCDRSVGFYNLSGFCDGRVNQEIRDALVQQVTDPGAANDAWTNIDHRMVDDAAVIPYGNDIVNDFVSHRVGNFLRHPVTGPLIAQMWVQKGERPCATASILRSVTA